MFERLSRKDQPFVGTQEHAWYFLLLGLMATIAVSLILLTKISDGESSVHLRYTPGIPHSGPNLHNLLI